MKEIHPAVRRKRRDSKAPKVLGRARDSAPAFLPITMAPSAKGLRHCVLSAAAPARSLLLFVQLVPSRLPEGVKRFLCNLVEADENAVLVPGRQIHAPASVQIG